MKKYLALLFFLILAACAHPKIVTPLPKTPPTAKKIISSQQYKIHQHLSLVNEGDRSPDKQNLWVALIRDVSPYQKILSRQISPDTYALVTDEYNNEYAEFNFSNHPANTIILVDIDYEVAVNEIAYDLSNCEGILPIEYTQPELHIESANPQIQLLSANLSKNKKTICEKVQTFYNYVGDELTYSYNHNDWGAQAAMNYMGADCTEYSDLMIALNRAAGIPARYYEGLLYLEDTNTEIANIQHAWLDVYLPGIGWAAMDPTLGRLPVSRETYFAHHTANHIIVTMGRNPSSLRGANYWSHLYWPGDSTIIRVQNPWWMITPIP